MRFTVTGDVLDGAYEALIRFCFAHAERGYLVSWHGKLSEEGSALLHGLITAGGSSQRRSEWPGSRLLEPNTANVITFPLTSGTLAIILGGPSTLFGWVEPDWPNDIGFLRGNDDLRAEAFPLLSSVTNDEIAHLELGVSEMAILAKSSPELTTSIAPYGPVDQA